MLALIECRSSLERCVRRPIRVRPASGFGTVNHSRLRSHRVLQSRRSSDTTVIALGVDGQRTIVDAGVNLAGRVARAPNVRHRSRSDARPAMAGLLLTHETDHVLGRSRALEAIAPDRRRVPAAARLLSAHSDHAVGRRGIALGRRGRPMPRRSDSAADAAGLERLGLCVARLKRPSAGCRETTEAVAKA